MAPHRARTARPLLALTVTALASLAFLGRTPAEAGGTKRYRDAAHKFSLLIPADFERVPLQPAEETQRGIVARFTDSKNKGANVGTYPAMIEIVRIDTEKGLRSGPVITGDIPPELAEQIERMGDLDNPKSAFDATIRREMKYNDGEEAEINRIQARPDKKIASTDKPQKVPGQLYRVEHPVRSVYGENITLFMMLAAFKKDTHEYGVFMQCGGRLRKKFESDFYASARSFRWFDENAEDVASLDVLDGMNITAKRRRGIERGLVQGWDVIVSPKKNYIILYNTNNGKNKLLAKIIAERIEKIREQIYEVQFPPTEPIDAVSIVRICKDRDEYMDYGAPGGSAGYWSSHDEELVFYDASPSKKPDDDTLAVLYHEAFHQYIYYSVGNVAPHSWFNEGHGDYYAGAKYKGGKFQIEPFDWRVGTIRGAIVTGPRGVVEEKEGRKVYDGKGGYTPLDDFVRFTQGEYYSYPGISYAQGWSLIYFLREIVPKNKKYREKWGNILTVYFDTLKAEVKKDKDFEGFRAGGGPAPDDDGGEGEGEGDGEDVEDGDEAPPTPPTGPAPKDGPDSPPADGGPPPKDGPPPSDDPDATFNAPMQQGGFGPDAALKKAVDEAFKDVDWAELEAAWKEGTRKGR